MWNKIIYVLWFRCYHCVDSWTSTAPSPFIVPGHIHVHVHVCECMHTHLHIYFFNVKSILLPRIRVSTSKQPSSWRVFWSIPIIHSAHSKKKRENYQPAQVCVQKLLFNFDWTKKTKLNYLQKWDSLICFQRIW